MPERWFMARCRGCDLSPMPFKVSDERAIWCKAHRTGHTVFGEPDVVIDKYEELQRYRQTYLSRTDPMSKTTDLVCGHDDCPRENRLITLKVKLGAVLSVQDVMNAIDQHWREKHDDE